MSVRQTWGQTEKYDAMGIQPRYTSICRSWGGGLLNGPEALNVHFVKVNLCTAYCYKTIISQYAIITDSAGVQPIRCRLGLRPRAQAGG